MPDEMLDILDNNDNVTGQTMRSIVHARGLWHRGVHIFLFTGEGKLLIQMRSKERAQYPSVWDCSVSEHIKAGESYREAAVRGLKEELGMEGIGLQPLVRFRMNYGSNDNEISTLFKGLVDPAQVCFDSVEIERVEYLLLDEMAELIRREEAAFSYWLVQLVRWHTSGSSDMQVLQTYQTPLLPKKSSL
jgi:isopentenyl-diphosphate delta-isomerase type 1